MNANSSSLPRQSALHPSPAGLPLKALATAICGVLGLSVASHALAASSQITQDGKTATTVTPSGAPGSQVFSVTTGTINAGKTTAFNSFHNFTVVQGDTVNLHLPGTTTNLVNLVWDAQASISGTVNSYLNSGVKGGSVYFADPYGIVVGKTGVLNVGALSLSAPTTTFMNSLLTNGNVNPDNATFTTLMQGQEPLAEATNGCLVCVAGTINATNAVRIRATAIDVSGMIYVTGNGTDTLSTAVNVEGSTTPVFVTDGNTIRLMAQDSNAAAAGDAVSSSSVNVSGTLQTASLPRPNGSTASASSWGQIAVTAEADSSSAFTNPTDDVLLGQAGDLFRDQSDFFAHGVNSTIQDANLATADKLGMVAYVRSYSTATVSIGGTINAGGSVLLQSSTQTSATTDASVTGANGSSPVMISAMYGAVYSKASTTIASGASVTSVGQLSVQSSTDNTLKVAASTEATDASNFAATTVAWSQAAVDAEAMVNGAVSAGSLDIGAHNSNAFTTSASATASNATGSVGIAGAVSLQTVKANATLDASPVVNGDITVAAESDNTINSTSAKTATAGAADAPGKEESGANADLSGTMTGKTGNGSDGASTFASKVPFKLGSAVAWTDSDNAASATIGDGVTINTGGNLAVHAVVNDTGIHNGASSDTASAASASDEDSSGGSGGSPSGSGGSSGGSGGPTTVNVSAAVAYGNYQHQADAEIGSGDNITALNIGIGSQVLVPFDWTFGQSAGLDAVKDMGDSLDDFIAGAQAIPGLLKAAKAAPETIGDGASGYASASASDAKIDIGGQVNYFAMSNTDRAWVGSGTTLKSTAAAATTPGSDSWSTTLDWDTTPVAWAHSVSVTSTTDVTSFNLVGDITPWSGSTEGDKAAIGGAFNYGGYENSTVAGLGSGVSVSSKNDVAVIATGKDSLFVLSPVSGKGGTASLQGTVAITDVDDHTHATLSASDLISARALDIDAANPLMVWSLSGAVAMSNQDSIGISIGVNSLTTDTLASIGDNSADETLIQADQATAPVPVTGLKETGGKISVVSLSVSSASSGESGVLSIAGSSVSDPDPDSSGGSSGSTTPPDPSAAAAGSGSSLLDMLKNVQSVADKLRGGSDKLQSVLGAVDELSGASTGGSSLLDQASDKLETISNGDQTLQDIVSKATSLGSGGGAGSSGSGGSSGTGSSGGGSGQKPSFGLGISGAAAVNMAQLNTRAVLEGATIDDGATSSDVAVQAINNAQLGSIAGGAAVSRAKATSGGDLAGAVAYSSVADTSAATVDKSTLKNSGTVAVQALDGSEQIAIGIGAAVQTGTSGTSATLAGSVSIATSANHTTATISDSTLDGGTGNARSLDVTAYDDSRLGIGAGSLAVNTGSGNSANGALGFSYADIADQTAVNVTGHTAATYDIDDYDTLQLRALDSSQIGVGVATGTVSSKGAGLAGAFIWNQIGNSTQVTVDDGMRIKTAGAILVEANAIDASDASVAALNSAIAAPASASGFDFSGAGLAFTGTQPGSTSSGGGTSVDPSQPGTASLTGSGWGSSIIAVAGDVTVGKNNVGLSFVGSQVSNTHEVSIGDADLESGGAIGLQADDNTRVISLAVGVGVSTGTFAGLGSATYNHISNTDSILLGSAVASGDSASLQATSVTAQAQDASAIYSLAGNVAISKGNAAASGAVTYNDIVNTVSTNAGATSFNVGSGAVDLDANNNATVMAGAVAGAVAKGTGLALSFGWNQTANTTSATLDDGSVVSAGSLGVNGNNASNLYALAGSVGIGGQAAVGLAGSVADIGDNTTATLQDAGLDISGAAQVQASGSGQQYTLGIAGSFAGDGAGAGSFTYNTINDDIAASASQIYGLSNGVAATGAAAQVNSLTVQATNDAAISSLAGGIGIGGDAGVGAAVSVSTVGGSTSASLGNSVLDVVGNTDVEASSGASIQTISVAGAAAGSVAVSGSSTTNIISSSVAASMSDVGTGDGSTNGSAIDSTNRTTVSATNNASIDALAGAVSGSGSAAVGAAVAVNQISGTTDASFLGGAHNRTYKTEQLLVTAGSENPNGAGSGNSANINAIAVGAAGGGDAGVAGSVAVNLLSGGTDARIDQGANVIANSNVGVLASNDQGIDVLAGAVAIGGTAGVGVGVVINSVASNTSAGIYSSNVSAYGNDSTLSVDSGTPTNGTALDSSIGLNGSGTPAFISNPSSYTAPDLSSGSVQIHGVAVNASNQQHIATLGVGASLSGSVSVNALAAVNEVGGDTTAVIQNANINQADRIAGGTVNGHVSGDEYTSANSAQQVDVRASSRQYEASLVANVAGSGTVAADGAVATNVFDANTKASIIGTTDSSQAGTSVDAFGNQWSLAGAMGAAVSGEVGGAASASVSVFKASTDALVDGGSFDVGGFNLAANNATSGSQLGGAIGFGAGTAGIAGVAVVNVDNVETSATVQDHALIDSSDVANVQATSSNNAQAIAAGGAAGLYAGIAGAAVVNVIGNSTHASIDDSSVEGTSVTVSATDSQAVNAYSGVLGAGIVGVGGGINLSLLQASVGAGVLNSTLDATSGGVTVNASSTRNVTSVAASAGVGGVGVGLSAGIVVAGSGDISDGGSTDSQGNLNASGQVNLGNLSSLAGGNRVDSNTSDYGLSSSQLSAGDVSQINTAGSFNLAGATGSDATNFGASDGVQALVSGGSVTAQQGVGISATVANSTSNTAGGFAVGAIAVGGSLAYTTLNSDIQASVAGGTTIHAGNGISIAAGSSDASGGPSAYTHAIAGAGGLVGVSAAVSISQVDNTITASDAGTLAASTAGQGTLSIHASDSSSASAGNANVSGVSVAGIAAGTVVVDALRNSNVTATIAAGTHTSGFGTVSVSAADTGAATAQGLTGVGGLFDAVSGVVANASDNTQVTASIGAGANVNAGSTQVSASAAPTVLASAEGISVAGVAGIGANVAEASVDNDVQSLVGDNAIFSGGNLGVMAAITPKVTSSASGGAGAALLGVNAAVSGASDTSTVAATVGNDVSLPGGSVTIAAASSTLQSSSAKSITVGGILAAGAADATSSSTVNVSASLGNGNGTLQATTGNLAIMAAGQDTNDAASTAGSGGLIAGNASLSTTQSTSTTSATVGQDIDLGQLANFSLTASHASVYGGQADSTNAAAIGGSGANVDNSANSATQTSIGNNSTIGAQDNFYVSAQSTFASDANNAGASGGAGGIVAGEAAGVSTTLTANNTTTIGSQVTLAAGLDPNDVPAGNLTLLADTTINGVFDQSSLSVYGAVPIANAVANLQGTFNSSLVIGNDSSLSSSGRTDIATYAQLQKIGNQAVANTGGIATVGTADATVGLTSNQQVTIGNNVTIASIGEADIVAGKDIVNSADTELNPSAVAQAYVRGLIAIPHASATANTTSNASLILGSGSQVIGGGDVAIGSMSGTTLVQTDGTGHGYELGFIPATQNSNKQNNVASANTTIDGSVLAGKFDKIAINIAADGTLTDGGSTAPYFFTQFAANCSTPAGCLNPTSYLINFYGPAAQSSYQGFDNTNVGAYIISGTPLSQTGASYGTDIYVSGGNVYLYGSSIVGNGSVTANGAPSITINNASADYLILPGMNVKFGSAGSVIVAGGADPNHLGGITVSQAPSNAQPTISVNSSFPIGAGATPGIVFLNDVDNLGGSVTINDSAGSLIESPINANSVTITAPNGGILFNHPTQDFNSDNESVSSLGTSGSWLSSFLNTFTNSPDNTAAAIANAVYGNGATDVGQLNSNLLNYNDNPGNAQKTPVVLYGYCAAYTSGADGCGVDSGWSGSGIISGKSVDTVPYIALSQSGNFTNPSAPSGSYGSKTLTVTANFININSPIYVGTPATWTVQTTPALTTWMNAQTGSNPIAIPLVDGNGNALLSIINGGSQLIGASYNPSTKQIILNDVNASGGGEAFFDGKVVSTGDGSVHVNSGFGQVVVNNTTGDALVVNNIYTGNGGLGLITFQDSLNTLPGNVVRKTWYVSQNGGPAQIYDNSNGGLTWETGQLLGGVTSTTAYQPLAGEEYTWSASTSVNRSGGSAHWSWGSAGAGTAGQSWSLGTASFVGNGDSGHENLNGNDYLVSLSGTFTSVGGEDVWYHGCGNSIGSGCHYSTSATGSDPSDKSGTYHSEWDFLYPTAGTLTLDFTQRADLPINIAFSTSQSNSVEIDSNANILLNGLISNTNAPSDTSRPDTLLKATNGGSILQNSATAVVWTHDLSMVTTGGGSIGTAADPIQTRIVHDSAPGSTLSANTDGGAIYVNVDSGNSNQAINAIAQGADANNKPVYGNVSITGTGSLVGIAGHSRDVIGDNVNLVSTLGSIGTLADPLNIETHPDTLYNGAIDNGSLNAQARGDIGLVDFGGDVWVGSIVSTTGDVALSAPNGGIYDARLLSPATTLSQTQAQAIWARLQLTTGAAAQTIVSALQNQVDAAYAQYWQLLSVGTVSNGVYTLNPGAVALYWPLAAAAAGLDPASVTDPAQQASLAQSYASSRYGNATSLFTTYVGANWQTGSAFVSQQSAYSYVIDTTSALYTSIVNNTQWSTDQLTYAINIAALAAPSGVQVGLVAPNISAQNIVLNAGNGGIGNTAAPIAINYQDFQNLYSSGTASQALQNDVLALGMANTPGDIVLLDSGGHVLLPTDPGAAASLATISIAQTNPIYLQAAGAVSGSASGSVYVQANGDLNLAGLQSGSDMRLAATGSIDAATGSTLTRPALTTGGNLVINAGSGSVSFGDGTDATHPGDALSVQIAGSLLSGSASGNFMLSQVNGDLNVGSVFGGGLVSLTSRNGSILGAFDGLSIEGDSIDLNAAGDIGRRTAVSTGIDAPLQVQVGSSGLLNATAGGAVNIESPLDALQVGTISSGGDLTVTATLAALDAQLLASSQGAVNAAAGTDASIAAVQAATGATLTAAGRLDAGSVTSTAGDITLAAATGMSLQSAHAQGGNVFAHLLGTNAPQFLLDNNGSVQAADAIGIDSGGSLTMGQGSSMLAGDTVSLTSAGDMQLGTVQSTAAASVALVLQSGGAISGNGATVNLQARQGGTASLQSVDDIGSAQQPLVVDVNTLTGNSSQGDVYLHALGDIAIPDFNATLGSLSLSADQTLDYTHLLSGTSTTLAATRIDGGVLSAGTSAQLASTGATTVASVTTGSDLTMTAGTTLDATTLKAGGNASLNSDGTMTLGQVNTGANLIARAGGDLAATTIDTTGTTSLTSGQAMALGAVSSGGDLVGMAGTSLHADTLGTGGSASLTATQGDLGITGSLTTAQDARLSAGQDTDIVGMSIGGTLVSGSGANTHIEQGTVTGTSQLNAGAALNVDNLLAAADVTTQAGGDSTLGDVVLSGGSLHGNAGGAFNITQLLNVQNGNAWINSGLDMDLAQVITAGTLTVQAGGNLQSGILTIGTDGQLGAGGSIALLGATTAGHSLGMLANDHLGFSGITAGNDVSGQSLTDGIDGNSVTAGGSIRFVAAKGIHIGNQQAGVDIDLQAGTDIVTQVVDAGHDVNVGAGGNVQMFSTSAGHDATVASGGALTLHDMQAGEAIGLSAQQMSFASLTAPDSITLLATDGSILGAVLTTRDAFAEANGDIELDAAFIGDRINLGANDITAHVSQTSTGQPLFSVLTGYQGGVARSITVDASASQLWMIDRLAAVQAALATTAPRADIQSGHIEQTMSLDTSIAKVRMNQQQAYLVKADVQLMQPAYDFLLYQDGIHTLTDSFVVRFGYGFQIQTPNFVDVHIWATPDYLGESALRYNGRFLTQQDQSDSDVPTQRAIPTWMREDSSKLVQPVGETAAVNLKSPDAPE